MTTQPTELRHLPLEPDQGMQRAGARAVRHYQAQAARFRDNPFAVAAGIYRAMVEARLAEQVTA